LDMDNFNRVMGSLAATALVALMFLAVLPAQAFSHDANYIYVYPNNAVRVLVNGSTELSHEVPGNTSIAVTFYENSTLFRIHHTGLMPNLSKLRRTSNGMTTGSGMRSDSPLSSPAPSFTWAT